MYPPCRSHRGPDRAIRCADDAIQTLVLATSGGEADRDVVACVGADRQPLILITLDHPGRPHDLEAALDTVLGAVIATEPVVDAIFLGSSRPHCEPGPTPQDEDQWRRMADACADVGVELLDWFLLCEGATCSVAEGLVPGPRW